MCFHQFLPKSLDFLLVSLRFFVRKNEIFLFSPFVCSCRLKEKKIPQWRPKALGSAMAARLNTLGHAFTLNPRLLGLA